jgi:hypothetical protein
MPSEPSIGSPSRPADEPTDKPNKALPPLPKPQAEPIPFYWIWDALPFQQLWREIAQTTKPIGGALGIWIRRLNPSWEIVAVFCVLILSGTALFIYDDFKAVQLKQLQQAGVDKQKKEMSDEDVYGIATPATARQQQAPNIFDSLAPAPAAPVFSPARPPQFVTPKPPDPILDEMRRANDIAEDAAFQTGWNMMRANEIAEDAALQTHWDSIRNNSVNSYSSSAVSPPKEGWVLKYNYYSKTWQYAPPNAELKYNYMENRWEFVPQ